MLFSKKKIIILFLLIEVEYVVFIIVVKEVLWFWKVLKIYCIEQFGLILIYEDNQFCIVIVKNLVYYG